MPQTHSRIQDGKRLIWHTAHLWQRAADLQPFPLAVESIAELNLDCWFDGRAPSLREMAAHATKTELADLRYPIILNADGSLMDGGHRVCKALMRGQQTIMAVRFESMPKPDEIIEVGSEVQGPALARQQEGAQA